MNFPVGLVHVISSLGMGGAEAMLDKLTAQAPRDGVSVVCLTGDGPIGDRIAGRGIPVWTLRLGSGLRDLASLCRLWGHLRRHRPRVVQTWLYHGDLIGGLIARLAGVEHVVWNIRNSGVALQRLSARTRAVVRLNAWLSHRVPSRILCCSETARRNHIALGYAADKFFVIPNGFDIERFAPDSNARRDVRVELGLPADSVLVGLVARFDPQKNHRGFVEAAQIVNRSRPDVFYLLAGRGVDYTNSALKGWIDDAGIAASVRLLGERDDMPRITAALDVAVNSSLGEGFPNAVGEAMACGVPCVVTEVGDSADIVGQTGRAVPSGDMTGFAARVLDLLAMPDEDRARLGQAARLRIADNYEISRVVQMYQSFYSSLLSSRT